MNSQKADIFECKMCDFQCCKKGNFYTHLSTAKHKNRIIIEHFKAGKYNCKTCGKNYKARNSCWYHEQKCLAKNVHNNEINKNNKYNENNEKNENNAQDTPVTTTSSMTTDNFDLKNLVINFMQSNNELQKQNTELQKMMMNICQNIQPTNIMKNSNNNNKTFNLQFFLNETCKDAMNISEFVDSFQLQFADLERLGELGYVEGMSKLIIQKLNELDIHKRPIHCSDVKRDTLHIKSNNKWEKETPEYTYLTGAIKRISNKNIDLLFIWKKEHPNVQHAHNKFNDQYMKLIKEVMGGSAEIDESEKKIIRNIAKQVIIEK